MKTRLHPFLLLASLLLLIGGCRSIKQTQIGKLSGEPVYNVQDFGAQGDGLADDTHAIQQAINYAMEQGGGTVYFPHGRYRLATLQEGLRVKAHLLIPPQRTPDTRDYVMICLKGACCVTTPCAYASHTTEDRYEVWENGSVLFSDTLGAPQTDPSQPPVSILAAASADNVYGMNPSTVRLEDLAFQVKAEEGGFPYLSGVNMAYAATVYADNVLIYASTRNMVLHSPSAEGHFSAGFIAPRTWCNPEEELRNVNVKSAFRYGFLLSEHANGNDLSAWNCDEAFVFSRMDHSAWLGRIHAQNCAHILSSLEVEYAGHTVGNSYIKIEQVGVEVNSGQKPLDFNYKSFVNDPKDRLYGRIWYHIVKSNVGADNSYYVTLGGTHLQAEASF
ncbi:MAG: glycosyl hydrolase family 28-related protein [Alistipes sp.]|nr:glycosyl hydrolase family 28-related protein [Alistipes sp.]